MGIITLTLTHHGRFLNSLHINFKKKYLDNYIILFSGFGIDQLRDDCMDTYWQSDGQLPHLVNIQFQRKTMVSHIYIYTDYKLDESYTPSRISIRAGTHFNDLQEIEVIELIEPSGKYIVSCDSIVLTSLFTQMSSYKDDCFE